MRRLIRFSPEESLLAILQRHQREVDFGKSDVEDEWNRFRGTVAYKAIRQALAVEAGDRERCFYCSDSLGTDIEHFRPKIKFAAYAFKYTNFLLVCSACNRAKASKFPMDEEDFPLLIDPTWDDPWDSLFLDDQTGLIVPRINPEGNVSAKGSATIDILGNIVNRDSVALGRKGGWDAIVKEFRRICDNNSSLDDIHIVMAGLLSEDRYGLLAWMLRREGSECRDVQRIRNRCPELWRNLRDSI